MAFLLINRSPVNIQQIPAYTSRTTSIGLFNQSIQTILNLVENLAINEVQPFPRNELLRLVGDTRFAFRRIHQREQPRRFPSNLAQLWAYFGLPIRAVSRDLGVSVALLRRRTEEECMRWPNASDAERLLVAVQFADPNEVLNRFLRVRRCLVFDRVHEILRQVFVVAFDHGEVAITEVHVEIRGSCST